MIVKDAEDTNEIFRKKLSDNIPETPSSGSDYWWNYKWTMEDFLIRGLHKFVDEAQPFDNNKKEVKPASNNPYANFSCGGD